METHGNEASGCFLLSALGTRPTPTATFPQGTRAAMLRTARECAGIAQRGISRSVTPPDASPSHPLPAGMRDLLPEEAGRRRALARRLLDHLRSGGYALVTPPAFEFAEVLERGLGALDPSDVLRFVEPESGEVAALRPDMTPQIARMIATRLRRRPRRSASRTRAPCCAAAQGARASTGRSPRSASSSAGRSAGRTGTSSCSRSRRCSRARGPRALRHRPR